MCLKPVSGRSNLTVVTQARTLGVNLEDGRGETVARGVTFTTGGADGDKHSGNLNHPMSFHRTLRQRR